MPLHLRLPCALAVLLVVAAYRIVPSPREVTATATVPPAVAADLDAVFRFSQSEVVRALPNPRYSGLVYFGRCGQLTPPTGRVVLVFIDWRDGLLFGETTFLGTATTDLSTGSVRVATQDESGYYATRRARSFAGDQRIKAMLAQVDAELTSQGIRDCDVDVGQIDGGWDVWCRKLEDFARRCSFRVDDDGTVDRRLQVIH